MNILPQLERLSKSLSLMPGIGERSALRMAIFLLQSDTTYTEELATAIKNIHEGIMFCEKCYTISDSPICPICFSESRDKSTVCVVSSYIDMLAIENTNEYNGVFHVLHGLISPLKGIGIDDIKIKELFTRIEKENFKEIIFALNHGLDSDTTISYIKKKIQALGKTNDIKITKIAYGLSLSSDIEHSDIRSLGKSIIDRTII